VIKVSAVLVATAIAVLVSGVVASTLAVVYVSIGLSALAMLLFAAGVLRQRAEIFGEPGADTRQPARWPRPGTDVPVVTGGRDGLTRLDEKPAHPGGKAARGRKIAGLSSGQPWYPLRGRRSGVKMAGGTARDVVAFLVRWRPPVSLTLGAGYPKGLLIVASSTRVSFFRSPPVPRAVPPRTLAVQGQERGQAWKR
jgi:hypothetical protein